MSQDGTVQGAATSYTASKSGNTYTLRFPAQAFSSTPVVVVTPVGSGVTVSSMSQGYDNGAGKWYATIVFTNETTFDFVATSFTP